MSLCELHGKSRAELLASMDNAELTKLWVRHRYISPLPNHSRLIGKLIAAIYNVNRGRESPWFDADDFMEIVRPKQERDALTQTMDEQQELATQVHRALGGQ